MFARKGPQPRPRGGLLGASNGACDQPPPGLIIEPVAPSLHHLNPLVPIGGAVVDCSGAAAHLLGHRALDSVRVHA